MSTVSAILPASREEVQVVSVPPSPPDKADTGAPMESQQGADDDVSLRGCCGHQREDSGFNNLDSSHNFHI